MIASDNQTIVAQATPSGSGALALIRLSGAQVFEQIAPLCKLASHKKITDVATHTVHYGWAVDTDGTIIDQVMFIVMHGPATFTGQDCLEITCHNNPFIIQAIIQRALTCGARLASSGEFTQRAVLNNKIDLVQAEAIHELITANTQQALKKSLAQLKGSFSHWIAGLEKDLLKALALSEASFEFIDEEMEFGTQIATIIASSQATIATIKKSFDQQQRIRQGVRIALIGSVNAGKSSLFNALLGTQRAIVTPIAGTTRDAIEAGMYKKTSHWTLIDTAGLRQTTDSIEQEGIIRSRHEAAQADIILLIIDQSRAMTSEEQTGYQEILDTHARKTIVVGTKADLPTVHTQHASLTPHVIVSSTRHTNLDHLERTIEEKIALLLTSADTPFLLNKRQFNLIIGLETQLNELTSLLIPPIAYELVSYHLNEALAQMSELTGKTISEQGMDAVFREFCVGK